MNKNLRQSRVLDALRAKKDSLQSERVRTSMMLSARIALALKEKGWSKGQLALVLKKNPSVVSRWLSGTHNFTSDTLSDIQKVLEIQLLVRSHEEQKPIITGYSVSDPELQGRILSKGMREIVANAAHAGGCVSTQTYTTILLYRSEEVINL